MGNFHVFIGGQEIGAASAQVDITHDLPALGDMEWRPSQSASASFEITDPAWAEVQEWETTRRSVRLEYEVAYNWSRWRRWLNAVLRLAWWPLGPERLPESWTATVDLPEMHVTHVAGGPDQQTVVKMTTA